MEKLKGKVIVVDDRVFSNESNRDIVVCYEEEGKPNYVLFQDRRR